MAAPIVHIRYRAWGAMQRDAREQFARNGYFIPVDLGLKQFATVLLHVQAPDGVKFVLSCDVVSAIPGAATAVQLGRATSKVVLRDLAAHADQWPAEAPQDGDPLVVPAADLDDESSDDATPRPASAKKTEITAPFEGFDVDMNDDAEAPAPVPQSFDDQTVEVATPKFDSEVD